MSSTMNSLRYVSIMFIYRKSTISVVVYMNQICPSLQRSHVVKSIRKQLNDKVEIVSLNDGAYRPLKRTLATILEYEVLKPCGIVCICAKSVLFYYRLKTEKPSCL